MSTQQTVPFEEVFVAFQEMQKARGEAISDSWIQDAREAKWYRGSVNLAALITPYSEFRGLVFYSRRGLTNAEALDEIMRSNCTLAKVMVSGGLQVSSNYCLVKARWGFSG